MKRYQEEFIDFCLENKVLKFGEFKLKSGRISPYFFNAGLFNDGRMLNRLGEFYAHRLNDALSAGEDGFGSVDLLLGPAYKGIPLVAVTVSALFQLHGINLPYAFNRKEAKDHGEGGLIVGSQLKGNIVVVDDVITAGTAIREVIDLIDKIKQQTDVDLNPKLVGVLIALDRQEKGQSDLSAIQQLQKDYGIKVFSIISISDILQYLEKKGLDQKTIQAIKSYRQQYGVQQ